MKAAIVEILDGPWNSAIEPEFPIDPSPSFQVQMNIREGVEDVIAFPSAYIRTLVEGLDQ